MYVCICNSVTDRQIQQEICSGSCTMRDLCQRLSIATQCGKCSSHAKQILQQSLLEIEQREAL